ncbi:DNA cytosine methyltransferase [Mariniphaga sp.]|uniref:DNA cytosine methyltransferase n=1 Tax=Mariniphaga sp. TaxID=1954475 RepID=UPI003562166A
MSIPVIDLFAGPGGLGEGFSSVTDDDGIRFFDIKLSIEKDFYAHQTLELRSFLRQFPVNQFPEEYYRMVKENDYHKRDQLKKEMFDLYEKEYKAARDEAWQCELGHEDFPPEVVDTRIETALKGNKNWVLIGGPPCQAYSVVGRSRNKGISEDDSRVFLYREYLRIIARHHPKVFVMENVKGLLSAKLNGNKIFDWIKKDLKNPGRLFPGLDSPNYRIYSFVKNPSYLDDDGNPVYDKDQDYLIRSELYEIPQKRHRVILLGVREDTDFKVSQIPLGKEITLNSVLDGLPKIRSVLGREIKEEILINGRKKRIYNKLPDNNNNWKKYIEQFKNDLKRWPQFDEIKNITHKKIEIDSSGNNYIPSKNTIEINHPLFGWFYDPRLEGVIQHESRSHLLDDLRRYYFYSIYSKIYSTFPRLKDLSFFDEKLLPRHKNVNEGLFEDRFRVQLPNRPATTITSHISKDGHYFIHYEPEQCRSFTVREAARVQTFPDNYFFCGARTQQFHQVGNAVPPFLAYKLGYIVKNVVKNI